MKVELEEAKKVEDILLKKINDKIQEPEKLEEEVVCLRNKLENGKGKLSMNTPWMTSSEKLDKILNFEISPLIKARIGYEGETSKSKLENSKSIIFVKSSEAAKRESTELETGKTVIYNESNRNKQQPQVTTK